MTYIVFEGPDGSGKSTQAKILANKLDAVLTKEPGATALGGQLREILLNDESVEICDKSEALLMAADRAQHIDQIVKPALDKGDIVISDRSVYSSMAYQGFARGLGFEYIAEMNRLAIGDCWPDLVVLIDVSPDVAASRLNRKLDRFESAGQDFYERVAVGFRELAQNDPDRWIVVSGDANVDKIADQIETQVKKRI